MCEFTLACLVLGGSETSMVVRVSLGTAHIFLHFSLISSLFSSHWLQNKMNHTGVSRGLALQEVQIQTLKAKQPSSPENLLELESQTIDLEPFPMRSLGPGMDLKVRTFKPPEMKLSVLLISAHGLFHPHFLLSTETQKWDLVMGDILHLVLSYQSE